MPNNPTLPYALVSADGLLLVVDVADGWTARTIRIAEEYGIEWHGETLSEIINRGPQPGSPFLCGIVVEQQP